MRYDESIDIWISSSTVHGYVYYQDAISFLANLLTQINATKTSLKGMARIRMEKIPTISLFFNLLINRSLTL